MIKLNKIIYKQWKKSGLPLIIFMDTAEYIEFEKEERNKLKNINISPEVLHKLWE